MTPEARQSLLKVRAKWDNYRLRYPDSWSQERGTIDAMIADLDAALAALPSCAPPEPRFQFSREWCEKAAQAEADAGHPDITAGSEATFDQAVASSMSSPGVSQIVDEMRAAADPSVTLQKVTFNQLCLWIEALASPSPAHERTEPAARREGTEK